MLIANGPGRMLGWELGQKEGGTWSLPPPWECCVGLSALETYVWWHYGWAMTRRMTGGSLT